MVWAQDRTPSESAGTISVNRVLEACYSIAKSNNHGRTGTGVVDQLTMPSFNMAGSDKEMSPYNMALKMSFHFQPMKTAAKSEDTESCIRKSATWAYRFGTYPQGHYSWQPSHGIK